MAQVSGSGRGTDRALVTLEALVGLAVVGAIVGQSYGAASTTVFLACGLAAAFSGWVLVRMIHALRDPSLEVGGRIEDEERTALEHEKLLLLQGIKELEADYAVGKVDPEDYQHLRTSAEQKAIGIITQLKASDQRWMAEAERLVAARLGTAFTKEAAGPAPTGTEVWRLETKDQRRARPALVERFDERPVKLVEQGGKLTCGGCGAPSATEHRYCHACGRPITAEAQ